MATHSEMADTIGISPSSFSKKASGIGLWTDDERVKLTRIYGKLAPKSAYDPQLTIDEQARTITAQAAEISRHVKGLKISLIAFGFFALSCLTLLAVIYAPLIVDALVDKRHGIEILQARNKYLEQYNGDLEILLDRWAAYDDKMMAEKEATAARYQELIDKIEEVMGE